MKYCLFDQSPTYIRGDPCRGPRRRMSTDFQFWSARIRGPRLSASSRPRSPLWPIDLSVCTKFFSLIFRNSAFRHTEVTRFFFFFLKYNLETESLISICLNFLRCFWTDIREKSRFTSNLELFSLSSFILKYTCSLPQEEILFHPNANRKF